MVCVYCGSPTAVSNSRLQKQNNHIWRRRTCIACGNVFTTTEQPELSVAFVVTSQGSKKLEPFNRDKLFLSILEACKHRTAALEDVASLTEVVINKSLDQHKDGVIQRKVIADTTRQVLARFDPIASTVYNAYHHTTSAPPNQNPAKPAFG